MMRAPAACQVAKPNDEPGVPDGLWRPRSAVDAGRDQVVARGDAAVVGDGVDDDAELFEVVLLVVIRGPSVVSEDDACEPTTSMLVEELHLRSIQVGFVSELEAKQVIAKNSLAHFSNSQAKVGSIVKRNACERVSA